MIHRERTDRWAEEEDARARFAPPLTRAQVQALKSDGGLLRSVSPWRVVGVQAVVGVVVALLAGLLTGSVQGFGSALVGAAAVVVPGALMARMAARAPAGRSPAAVAVSVLLWEMVKIMATVAILASAPRWVQPLHWPALLAGLVACLSVYALALTWRGRGN